MDDQEEQKTQVRVPKGVHLWLKARAKQNDRSMNAELVRLLKEAKEQEEQQQQK